MSSRLTQLLLALSLLLNCFVLAGFVYRSWIAPPHWQGRMGGPPPGQPGTWMSPLDALSQDLKLDDGQKQALKGLFEQYNTARRDRWREIQKVRGAMAAELQKPEFDMTRIEPLVEQMTRLRAEQQNESLRAISQLSPHLRPEQRDELHKILGERYGGGWGGRPGGPGGPRPPPPTQ
ncbi:Spy/CpxP family protein refolding chaperone [Reyranella sp.]|uniref:Spy/CpxP family protein refolding chaperone n=1 Tax=Reyranella sp. TaxID=1929291 RepID=UPI003D0F0C8A